MGHGEAAREEFHVLAVDDSFLDRKIIERLLKISSFQVTTVDSVGKALAFLGLQDDEDEQGLNANDNDNKVNMIITDYCMPGMTGYDLLRRVKESPTLKDIPVVIMSSENVESRITRCLSEGAQEFLLKPVKLSDVEKFRSYMHHRRPPRDHQHQSPPPSSNKRKSISDSLSPQAERRPRLSGLTVA